MKKQSASIRKVRTPLGAPTILPYRPSWREKIVWALYDSLARPLRNWVVDARGRREAILFKRNHSTSPPHEVKVDFLSRVTEAFSVPVFIETGTYRGDMCRRLANRFEEIYTIELDESFAERARRQFKKWPHIHVIQGDSGQCLGYLLDRLEKRALFWLDGHFSGGETACGPKETPLLDELLAIQAHKIKDHIILIDDARFLGTGDYPSLQEIKNILIRINPRYKIHVELDIVYCGFENPSIFLT